MTDVTKRAAKPKRKHCKLIMLCGKDVYRTLVYKKVDTTQRDLAYYYFLSLFESAAHCGESGAHIHVIDMEIAGPIMITPGAQLWPVSVTLNITLDEYREMRKMKKWGARRTKVEAQPMPRFKEIEEDA